jgi:hypothetical protein
MQHRPLEEEINMKLYEHTQIGYLIIIAVGIGMLGIIYVLSAYSFNWIGFTVLVVLGICLILFASLTVAIEGGVLEVRFGPGSFRKRFALEDIASCQIVKSPWYYGWGIRITPEGTLYNVSGLRSVELQMKNGKKYRIGTDEPERLANAIAQSAGRRLE